MPVACFHAEFLLGFDVWTLLSPPHRRLSDQPILNTLIVQFYCFLNT